MWSPITFFNPNGVLSTIMVENPDLTKEMQEILNYFQILHQGNEKRAGKTKNIFSGVNYALALH